MKTFITKKYEIPMPKLKKNSDAAFAVLADLHGIVYGENHQILFEAIRREHPDAVLVPGDMIVRTDPESLMETGDLLVRLAEEFPVYYALGNHEYKVLLSEEKKDVYLEYEKRLTNAGVCFLHNEHAGMHIRGNDFIFYGLELPMEYYKKPRSPKLTLKEMEDFLGTPFRDGIHVLLAHNPKYANIYFSWGADLTLCGHYHGGMIRLNEHHGLISPQFQLFPPYCCGDFHKDHRYLVVSAGLGEHTIPLRIHNPRELLLVKLKPFTENIKNC